MHLGFKKVKEHVIFFSATLFCILLFSKKISHPKILSAEETILQLNSFFFVFSSRDKYLISYFNDTER